MEAPEETRICSIGLPIAREFLEAAKERVNDDDICIQAVDARRKNEVETNSVDPAIPRPAGEIQKKPGKKLEEMWTADGWNSMPEDGPRVRQARFAQLSQRETLNALSIKMNLTMLVPREAFQQFGKSALRAMTTIDERRDDGEAQVSASESAGHTREQVERSRRTAWRPQG